MTLTTNAPPEPDRATRFTEFLAGLADREDRAALAALRRGLGRRPGEVADPCRYVDPWLTPNDHAWIEAAFYTVASLFATHPLVWRRAGEDAERGATNLGASLDRMAPGADSARPGVERRFTALLNSDSEDLATHLRHAIGLLSAKDVPVDWAQLLRDLLAWNHPARRVQRAWARAFWRQAPPPESSQTPAQETEQ
jgi:CRISPR system Cascade subunit CasB